MRLAIVSDTHFGDPMCTLVTPNNTSKIDPGTKYEDFKKAASTKNDYLILIGDIFDFSITSYQEAYEYAKIFFLQIQKDNIAKEIILVPGNHELQEVQPSTIIGSGVLLHNCASPIHQHR